MKRTNIISLVILLGFNLLIAALLYRFGHYEYADKGWLYGLLIVPLLSTWFYFQQHKRKASLNFSHLASQWDSAVPVVIRNLLFSLKIAAIACIIVAIARPQSNDSYENRTKEGINIVLAMDISASMLSRDFEPNRLESAKDVAIQFVDERPDDRIAVVVYEGESITQVPLTSDHRVVKNGIEELNTGLLTGGTAIGMGLATAVNRLKDTDGKSKVVILLTDGVNNSGQINPEDAAQMAELYGIRVYTIGVGTIGKAKSPVGIANGQYIYDWVEVEIDEETLKTISDATGGKYFRATSKNKLVSIYEEIDRLEKTRFNVLQYNRKTEEFFPFLFAALIFLFAEFLLKNTLFRSAL